MSQKISYGPILKTEKAEEFAMHIFGVSRKEKLAGRKGIPICAWGEAGIGKTELPNFLVKKYMDFFDGNVVYVPLGQIEEKAELQGLPDVKEFNRVIDPSEDLSKIAGEIKDEGYYDENGVLKNRKVEVSIRTIYATPSWIPQEHTHGKKGLLVIDDANRADGRIINSIMQLLQDGALLGWKLPEEWEIYLTCNPDNGKYQVTRFDGAQMTRMMNFEQQFDALSWARDWATPTGLHPLAINYVLAYPESICTGERTNPRSFDKFFRTAQDFFENPSDPYNLEMIRTLGLMNVEDTSLATFISFITDGFGKLPDITEILDGSLNLDSLQHQLTRDGNIRVDILNSLSCRLIIHINQHGISANQVDPMKKWLKHPMIPKEIRYKDTKIAIDKNMKIGDPELAKLLLQR
jgi:hypothetical protein